MPPSEKQPLPLAGLAGTLLAIAVWSILVLLSALAQREQLNRTAAELARIDAVANLKKDMAIRKWASSVEGVFIREERVPPINSLDEEERLTAIRSNGEQLRLVSVTPIHLLLAIQGQTNAESGSKERLTSNQLRNIQNAPDEWEKQALEALNKGAQMVTENLPKKGGHGLMRAMIPMKMEAECLECHRDTLIPVGGLRGGASVAIDLNTYRSAQEPTWQAIRLWHSGIWLLGIATILLLHYISRRRAADLQRVDEARRENETAFAAMAEGAVITDGDATILWVNDAFCRISGYERNEVVGSNPRMLKSGLHDSNFYAALWRQLSETGHWRGEIWNRRKNGEIFPEEISMQALRGPNGKIRRYISIFSDITERKKNENELARHREHLEDLVRQRTEELTVARDQAEAANRSKSLFLANMSHELRTPLNAVIGFSQLMENDPSLSTAQQHRLEIINHSGHHLLTLINDILELSKIESGKMKMSPEEVDLQHLLEQVVDMMRLRAEQLGLYLALETDHLTPVVLDPGMLRQVLLNLLSNALKFTPTGQVIVSARGTAIDAGQIRLEFAVRDTGIGISPEDCQRIFSSFEQVGSAHQGGTGLGLSISRRYVQMLGGELAVDSVPGKGSYFHFAIVAAVVDMAPPQHLHPDILHLPPSERGKRVLIVDDGQESRLLVRSLLEPIGFAIAEATNLAEARRSIADAPPDLILLDWFLPDGQGLDLIRSLPEPRPRVVMLTANALAETRTQSLAAGADDFLSKPFENAGLFHIIEHELGITFQRSQPTLPPSPPPAPDADALTNLPDALRAQLVQAAISLNPDEIAAAVAHVAEVAPELAASLSDMSNRRRYPALWELLGIMDKES